MGLVELFWFIPDQFTPIEEGAAISVDVTKKQKQRRMIARTLFAVIAVVALFFFVRRVIMVFCQVFGACNQCLYGGPTGKSAAPIAVAGYVKVMDEYGRPVSNAAPRKETTDTYGRRIFSGATPAAYASPTDPDQLLKSSLR